MTKNAYDLEAAALEYPPLSVEGTALTDEEREAAVRFGLDFEGQHPERVRGSITGHANGYRAGWDAFMAQRTSSV